MFVTICGDLLLLGLFMLTYVNVFNHIVHGFPCLSMVLHVLHVQFNVLCTKYMCHPMPLHVIHPLLVSYKLCLVSFNTPSCPFMSNIQIKYFDYNIWYFCKGSNGDDGNPNASIILWSKMKGHVHCFAKDKYEQVVVEAYYQLRVEVKMANNVYLISKFIVKHHARIKTSSLP